MDRIHVAFVLGRRALLSQRARPSFAVECATFRTVAPSSAEPSALERGGADRTQELYRHRIVVDAPGGRSCDSPSSPRTRGAHCHPYSFAGPAGDEVRLRGQRRHEDAWMHLRARPSESNVSSTRRLGSADPLASPVRAKVPRRGPRPEFAVVPYRVG